MKPKTKKILIITACALVVPVVIWTLYQAFFCVSKNGSKGFFAMEFSAKKFWAFVFSANLASSFIWQVWSPTTHWVIVFKNAGVDHTLISVMQGAMMTAAGWFIGVYVHGKIKGAA